VSPAFTGKQLTDLPTENWVTNGGTVFNQRYVPLATINRGNVSRLKPLWHTSLPASATLRPPNGAQILADGGVLYATNGANDVFALDAVTGKILWKYHPGAAAPVGAPNVSRGVALGDGKVFVGQRDAKLVALDQRTGKVVWSIQAEKAQENFSITSAPLYYDGLVITGFAAGDLGIRGRVKAYDAHNGALRWTFYAIPGPGEVGHDTWPAESSVWQQGGGAVWQTPAVDPELGLLYFSTGNAAPVNDGSRRAGDNLFTSSIVAVEAKTGKYRWHFQQVHHDIWDYDSPNPIVLFDVDREGRSRRALVEVSKTGWAYILDRTDGTPLLGIEERAVPQEPHQATAGSQPYPVGDSIVPQSIDIAPEGAQTLPGSLELENGGRIFTPFWNNSVVAKPGTGGGANWPPSSYDPETHVLYVCASDAAYSWRLNGPIERAALPRPGEVVPIDAIRPVIAGVFAALNVTTNTLVWRQQWNERCRSGSLVTSGGLVFVGRGDGRLTALDKLTGQRLWEFVTNDAIGGPVTAFAHLGKQYVTVVAGGDLTDTPRRADTVWMFSLDTAISGPARPATAASIENGARIFRKTCIECHGEHGDGGGGGAPRLIGVPRAEIVAVASDGRGNMPAFARSYSTQDLEDVADYVVNLLTRH
jgi:alcohol dehydrogenase (cytochrome c)